jgi:sulfate adenylyltransferase subunit 1 (EFTu-like GTPase family)
LIEFEQIYDEYIKLFNNEQDLDMEMVSLSKLLGSFIFSNDEKEAILNGELLQHMERSEIHEI